MSPEHLQTLNDCAGVFITAAWIILLAVTLNTAGREIEEFLKDRARNRKTRRIFTRWTPETRRERKFALGQKPE